MKEITADDLRHMDDQEGLILQGCGGDPQEWVDGINEMLTKEGVLLNGSKFQNVQSFQYNEATCLLFPFEGTELNVGRFAMWRLQTRSVFGGTWLSDFVLNRLGGFVTEAPKVSQEKPACPLIGEDGNIFNLMAIASRTLRRSGQPDKAAEMTERIAGGDCHSYEAALGIIGEYVDITSKEETQEMGGMQLG